MVVATFTQQVNAGCTHNHQKTNGLHIIRSGQLPFLGSSVPNQPPPILGRTIKWIVLHRNTPHPYHAAMGCYTAAVLARSSASESGRIVFTNRALITREFDTARFVLTASTPGPPLLVLSLFCQRCPVHFSAEAAGLPMRQPLSSRKPLYRLFSNPCHLSIGSIFLSIPGSLPFSVKGKDRMTANDPIRMCYRARKVGPAGRMCAG